MLIFVSEKSAITSGDGVHHEVMYFGVVYDKTYLEVSHEVFCILERTQNIGTVSQRFINTIIMIKVTKTEQKKCNKWFTLKAYLR